jgi:HK97 family phage major capsid protein
MSDLEKRLAAFETKVQSALGEIEKAKAANIVGGSTSFSNRSNSDEQKLLNSFGVSNVKSLIEVNTAHPRFAHISENAKAAVVQLKKDMDIARMQAQLFNGESLDRDDDRAAHVKGVLDTPFARSVDLKARLKSFGSTVAGQGDEWVPTAISASYIEEFQLERKLAGALREIPMSTNPFQLPVQQGVTKARLVGEAASATDAGFNTEKIQFDARKLVEYYVLPEELNEDSAPAILELARAEVLQAQIRAVEDSIINGDLSGTHMDSDVVSAASNQKAWNGLRKLALDAGSTHSFTGAGVTKAGLDNMRKLMGKYGTNPKELAWVVGPSGYAQMLNVDEVATVEKFGPQATILTGALAVFRGIPIIVSEFVREDLNAAGVYDGAQTTKTVIHLANIRRFYLGLRRPIRVKVQQDPRSEFDRWQLVSYQRLDFQGHKQAGAAYAGGASSTERSSILGINVLS